MNNTLTKCLAFHELSVQQLYAIMVIRQEVFMIEQQCAYLDADGRDIAAHHLMMLNEEGILLAYTRLLPEKIAYQGYTSIGRVANISSIRGTGIGKKLMQMSIDAIATLYGKTYPIKIGAQTYLLAFYENLGFRSTGEEYLEDNIPHTSMVRYWEKNKN